MSALVHQSSSARRQDYSSEYFSNELQSAEQALAALQQPPPPQDEVPRGATAGTQQLPLSSRLDRLTAETEDLFLLQAVTRWSEQCHDDDNDNLVIRTDECNRLAQVLRDRTNVTSSLFQTVYQREYLPLHEYLSTMLVRQVRQTLLRVGYPKSCATVLWKQVQNETDDAVGPLLHAWERLQYEHDQTILHVTGSLPPPASHENSHALVVELLRPLVTRVHYHFLQSDPQRPTSTRMDRLTEWLIQYIRNQFFAPKGPWQVIYYGWRPACTHQVLYEVARLVQFVLQERNLFRSQQTPTVLCRAMEEILQFDAFLQSWTNHDNSKDYDDNNNNNKTQVLSLTDSLIAGDEELLQWWLAVEQESLSAKLQSPPPSPSTTTTTSSNQDVNLMTPQAEVFGAMIRSIRLKASLFTSRQYLQQVAGPLCMQFLDAVHQTATELKQDLLQYRALPPEHVLYQNLKAWLALLNGTHWCAKILKGEWGTADEADDLPHDVAAVGDGDQDELFRFGESLERLEQVLVTDLIDHILGDTLLLQKAKLANYLMQSSHVLAGHDDAASHRGDLVPAGDLSVGLLEARDVLRNVLDTCRIPDVTTPEHLQHAAQVVSDGILQWTAHKFMEALLDASLVTEILAVGGRVVHKDVQLLLGNVVQVPQMVMRLLDVTHALQDVQLASIGDALCGLAGQAPPLTVDLFALDERLYEEAVSMIRAKGWLWLDLDDLLSVLNRRVDLSQPMAL